MRTQATLILPGLQQLKDLRCDLDSIFASRIPLHVTLIYDDEAPSADLLTQRLRVACAHAAPISLSLGKIARFDPPADGLYVTVSADAGFWTLRDQVLRAPFHARGPLLRPHVTLVHPSQAPSVESAWQGYVDVFVNQSVSVSLVSILEWDGGIWRIREEIMLGDG